MIRQVGMFPGPSLDRSDYQLLTMMADSISAQGWNVVSLTATQMIEPARLADDGIELVHLHWPSAFFHYTRRGLDRLFPINYPLAKSAEIRIDRWALEMRRAQVALVWEIHDLVSHHWIGKGPFSAVDERLHRSVYALSSGIIIHEASCLPPVTEFYGADKPHVVARLGDHVPFHGQPVDKVTARTRLEIAPHARVFAYIGTARRNRNPRATVAAFRAVAGPDDRLIVAGRVVGRFARAGDDRRVLVYDGPQDHARLRDIFCAADFVVNDAQRYLTSAVLRTAMSYGVPVIAYPYGAAGDMVAGAAIFIDEQRDGLPRALRAASAVSPAEYEDMVQNALANNKARPWSDFGAACVGLYERMPIG